MGMMRHLEISVRNRVVTFGYMFLVQYLYRWESTMNIMHDT